MKIRNRLLTRIGALLFAQWCRIVFLTVRIVRHHEGSPTRLPENSDTERYLFALWHDCVVGPLFGGHTDRLAVLTSRHKDGHFVTDVLKAVGVTTIRGSTSRGGSAAVREMMQSIHQMHLAITPDGPRGPRREMSRGLVYLASRTGSAIVPIGVAFSDCWRIKGTWTDLAIPKPFSRVALFTCDPIQIPADVDLHRLDGYVLKLQLTLDDLMNEAERRLGGGTRLLRRAA